MRTVHILLLVLMLMFTMGLYSQNMQSPTVTDAVQNSRLEQIERTANSAQSDITRLTVELGNLRSSLDTFTGIGIGFGAALTALQCILVVITIRNGGTKGDT